MSRFKTLFLGTPDIAVPCLEAISNDHHFDIVGVVTQPDRPAGRKQKLTPSPVKEFALSRKLPVFTPENINTPEVLKELGSLRPETAIVVAYGQILSSGFLALFPKKAVNVHASLLPRWRGAAPIQRALMEGDQETGVALQVIVPKLDAGPVIGSRKIALDSEINAGELYEKLKGIAPDLLTQDFLDYLRLMLVPVEQDESKVTIAKKIKKEEGEICWSRPASQIHNQVRGLWMWPGTWTGHEGKTLKIKKTRVLPGKGKPGEVISTTPDSFVVSCGEGALEVLEVQPESRPTMGSGSYMRGYSLTKGTRLSMV